MPTAIRRGFERFGLPVVPDLDEQRARAAGRAAGGDELGREHRAAANRALTHIATVSTDVPFLPLDLVERLAAAAGSGGPPSPFPPAAVTQPSGFGRCLSKPAVANAIAHARIERQCLRRPSRRD